MCTENSVSSASSPIGNLIASRMPGMAIVVCDFPRKVLTHNNAQHPFTQQRYTNCTRSDSSGIQSICCFCQVMEMTPPTYTCFFPRLSSEKYCIEIILNVHESSDLCDLNLPPIRNSASPSNSDDGSASSSPWPARYHQVSHAICPSS